MTRKRGNARKRNSSVSRSKNKKKQVKKPATKSVKKKVPFLKKEAKKLKKAEQKLEHEIEEEFFVPSPIHRGSYKIPLGIRIIIGYLSFVGILYLISFIYGISFPTTILLGKLMTGARAFIINSVLLVILGSMIYGFYRRKAYTFDLSIGFFGFTALNAFISLLLISSSDYGSFKPLMFISFVSLAVVNSVVIWYILKERKFFYAKYFRDKAVHHHDRVFVYTIVTFWVATLLLGITLGLSFYKESTGFVDNILDELDGHYTNAELLCDTKAGVEKDVCLLVAATAQSTQGSRDQQQLTRICGDIESDFYRFSCDRMLK